MTRSLRAGAAAVAVVVAGSLVATDVSSARAEMGASQVTVDYGTVSWKDSVLVSPNGQYAAFTLLEEGFDELYRETRVLITGVRVVDLTELSRDVTVTFPPTVKPEGLPIAFSLDGKSLRIITYPDIRVFDLDSFRIVDTVDVDPFLEGREAFRGLPQGITSTLEYLWKAYDELAQDSADFQVTFQLALDVVTLAGDPVFRWTENGKADPVDIVDLAIAASENGKRLYLSRDTELTIVPLETPSEAVTMTLDMQSFRGRFSIVDESPSGNLLFALHKSGFVIIDIRSKRVVAEFPMNEWNQDKGVQFSPDDRLVVAWRNSDESRDRTSRFVFDLETGESTPWEDPVFDAFDLSDWHPLSTGQSVIVRAKNSRLYTSVIDWSGPTMMERPVVSLEGDGPVFVQKLDGDRFSVVETQVDDSKYDPSLDAAQERVIGGTISVTYTFGTISPLDNVGISIPGYALVFDESGKIAVSVGLANIVSVWDMETNTRRQSFRLPERKNVYSESRKMWTFYTWTGFSNEGLMVSADGSTMYFAVERSEQFDDGRNGNRDITLSSMSLVTGEVTEIATFAGVASQAAGLDRGENRILLCVQDGFYGFDTNPTLELLAIDVVTGETVNQVEVTDCGREIVAVSPTKAVTYGNATIRSLDVTTGEAGRAVGTRVSQDWVRISPDGEVAIAFARDLDYDVDPGFDDYPQKAGALYLAETSGSDTGFEELARTIVEWEGEASALGDFSPDGSLFYWVHDGQMKAFSVPDGETVDLAPNTVEAPPRSELSMAGMSPDGATLWVRVDFQEGDFEFIPLEIPGFFEGNPEQPEAAHPGDIISIAGNSGWLIPGLLGVGSAGLVAVWWWRMRRNTLDATGSVA